MDKYRVRRIANDVMSLAGVYGSCCHETGAANKAGNEEEESKWSRRREQLHFMICGMLSDIQTEVLKESNEK